MTTISSGARSPLLRRLNTRDVLAALQRHGPLSRADITRRTGISGPTVTRTIAALLAARLVEEGEFREGALGRPGKVVRLARAAVSVLGLTVGARHCELVRAGLDGEVEASSVQQFATPSRYADLLRAIAQRARGLMKAAPTTVLGLGVSIPGLLNRRLGRTEMSPNLHQTDGRCLGVDLQQRLGIPVTMLQESHALCLAERTYGAARDVDDFAMFDISEGLGVGVVLGGRILAGHSGLAGELGHITVERDGLACGCGNRGCLETVATDTAFAAAVSRRLGRARTLDEILPLAQSGTLDASAEIERIVQYLAIGVAAAINIFNPSKLFIYGRFLDAGPEVFARLIELTRQRALAPSVAECEIIRAQGSKRMGALAGIIGTVIGGGDDIVIEEAV